MSDLFHEIKEVYKHRRWADRAKSADAEAEMHEIESENSRGQERCL